MTVNTPQTDLNNYIEQWQQANQQYQQDYASLAAMIQQMMALCAKGGQGTEEAFQIAEMGVMPTSMTVQGDTMGQLAASMNIGSACQEFTTGSQGDINGGTKMTEAQAEEFIKYLAGLYDDIKAELNLPKDQQWMDPNTANNLLSSLTKIAQEFEGPNATPDTLATNVGYYAEIIQNDINTWTALPTNSDSGQDGNAPWETGQQHLQNIQSDFQSWTNTQSAQSQSLTAQEQFASNTYNQYMNACTDVFQSSQQQAQNMVQNQKAQ